MATDLAWAIDHARARIDRAARHARQGQAFASYGRDTYGNPVTTPDGDYLWVTELRYQAEAEAYERALMELDAYVGVANTDRKA